VQAQILALLRGIQRDRGLAIVLITHDLGVVAEMADRVAVMYAGRFVEEAPAARLFDSPAHPYTRALFKSRPQRAQRGERLEAIDGSVPGIGRFPPGCRFHPRCVEARPECATMAPRTVPLPGGQSVECLAREGSC
jgi:oligopeptide/dipeptide ABC transporter ATP-binding protein